MSEDDLTDEEVLVEILLPDLLLDAAAEHEEDLRQRAAVRELIEEAEALGLYEAWGNGPNWPNQAASWLLSLTSIPQVEWKALTFAAADDAEAERWRLGQVGHTLPSREFIHSVMLAKSDEIQKMARGRRK